MLTNVQVVAGASSVARFEDVLVWFETGPQGGGVMLTQLLRAVQGVSSGSVPSRQLGARLAAVLNTGDATSVPALVAATPEAEGLRVVVHGWGAVVADGIHVPNGWVDQVIADRRAFFLGRNTVTPVAPVEGSPCDLEDGVVPGDGVSFALAPADHAPTPQPAARPVPPAETPPAASGAGSPWAGPPAAPTAVPPVTEPPADEPPPSDPPPVATPPPVAAAPAVTSWPPPGAGAAPTRTPLPAPGPAPQPMPLPLPLPLPSGSHPTPSPTGGQAAPRWSGRRPVLGRLVLDDGSTAPLDRTCVLGTGPQASPAVQTGVAVPLTVAGPGIAPVHVEIRVEQGQVAVRDLGSAPTYVLPPGATGWAPLAAGQVSALTPGTRVALGRRTISYERP